MRPSHSPLLPPPPPPLACSRVETTRMSAAMLVAAAAAVLVDPRELLLPEVQLLQGPTAAAVVVGWLVCELA